MKFIRSWIWLFEGGINASDEPVSNNSESLPPALLVNCLSARIATFSHNLSISHDCALDSNSLVTRCSYHNQYLFSCFEGGNIITTKKPVICCQQITGQKPLAPIFYIANCKLYCFTTHGEYCESSVKEKASECSFYSLSNNLSIPTPDRNAVGSHPSVDVVLHVLPFP